MRTLPLPRGPLGLLHSSMGLHACVWSIPNECNTRHCQLSQRSSQIYKVPLSSVCEYASFLECLALYEGIPRSAKNAARPVRVLHRHIQPQEQEMGHAPIAAVVKKDLVFKIGTALAIGFGLALPFKYWHSQVFTATRALTALPHHPHSTTSKQFTLHVLIHEFTAKYPNTLNT